MNSSTWIRDPNPLIQSISCETRLAKRDSWRRIGIKLFAKPSQLTLFRRRVFSGEILFAEELMSFDL